MNIEIELTPVVAIEELIELAKLVDIPGVQRLGISDVVLFPDSYQLQALCAIHTVHPKIGSLVTNPYTRHPTVLAAALSTLNDISNGRAFLGIGVGAGLSAIGITQNNPSGYLESFLEITKELLTGNTVNISNSFFHIQNAKLSATLSGTIPIIIGTRSERISKLAGRIADGVVVGTRELREPVLNKYREWVTTGALSAGRDPSEIEISPRVTVCISQEPDQARKSVVLYTAHYSVIGGHDPSIYTDHEFRHVRNLVRQASGWYFEPEVNYPEALNELIGPEIINRFAIAGSPSDCLAQIRTLKSMGFNSISMNIAAVRRPNISLYQGLLECLQCLNEIIPDISKL